MATSDAGDGVAANVIPFTRRSQRAHTQLVARVLRAAIASMKRKTTKAESAWVRRCESEGYVDPPKGLVIVL